MCADPRLLAPPQAFCREQDQPVEDQEGRRGQRGCEQCPDGFLQHQSKDPGRNRSNDEQPAELRVGVRRANFPVPDGSAETLEDLDPVFEKKEEQHDGGGQVGGDEERQKRGRVLVQIPAEKLRKDHAVTQAGNGKKLREALQETKNRSLDHIYHPASLSGTGNGQKNKAGIHPRPAARAGRTLSQAVKSVVNTVRRHRDGPLQTEGDNTPSLPGLVGPVVQWADKRLCRVTM